MRKGKAIAVPHSGTVIVSIGISPVFAGEIIKEIIPLSKIDRLKIAFHRVITEDHLKNPHYMHVQHTFIRQSIAGRMKHLLVFLAFSMALQVAFAQQAGSKTSALDDYLKLARQNEEAGDIKETTRFLNMAATVLWEDKKYGDAIQYFNQSIALNRQIENESGISKIQSNLGMIYADMQRFDESLTHFQESLAYRERSKIKPDIISCRINIAVVLNNLKRHMEAANHLEKALELATEMNDADQMKSCYGMLAETYEKAGNQERTVHYFNLYRTFHEMIQRNIVKEVKKEAEQVQLQALHLELEKKEKELELLRKSNELKATEDQLTLVSQEARSLIENNTKQQLAISLLERESELNNYKIKQVEDAANLQRITIALVIAALSITIVFSVMLFRNYKIKEDLVKQLANRDEEIKKLSTKKN